MRQRDAPATLQEPMEVSRGLGSEERRLEPEVREALESLGYAE